MAWRRLRSGYRWLDENLRWRGLWRFYAAGLLYTAAQNAAKPFALAAAMSAVHCDIPRELGTYTGSAHCGDKPFVIQEAQRMTLKAQAVGNVATALMTVVNAVASDCVHRKKMLFVVYAVPILSYGSMLCFLSGILGDLSTAFFYIAYVVDSLNPKASKIVATVWLDVTEGDDDRRSQMVLLRRIVGGVSFALSKPLAIIVLRMDLLDFRWIYSGLAGLLFGALALLSDLDVPRLSGGQQLSVGAVKAMFKDLVVLGSNAAATQMLLVEGLQTALATCENLQLQAFVLSVYGWRQGTLMLISLVVGASCMPLLGAVLRLSRLYGERRVFILVALVSSMGSLVCKLLLPFGPACVVLLALFMLMRQRALEPLYEAARAKLPQHRPELRGRTSALLSVAGSLMAAGVKGALLRLVDASATGYLGQMRPFLLLLALEALERLAFVVCVWPQLRGVLDEMTRARKKAMEN